jgi:hypothetical protein
MILADFQPCEEPLPVVVPQAEFHAEEIALLAALSDRARAKSYQLREALNLQLFSDNLSITDWIDITSLTENLEAWFTSFFQGDSKRYALKNLSVSGMDRREVKLMRRYYPFIIDKALNLGQQVTRDSPDPERATSAFHKALAFDLLLQQFSLEDQIFHLCEFMLLD